MLYKYSKVTPRGTYTLFGVHTLLIAIIHVLVIKRIAISMDGHVRA